MILSVVITAVWLIGLTWFVAGWAVAAVPLAACLAALSGVLYQFWRIAEADGANAIYQMRLQLAAERSRPGWRVPGDEIRAQDGGPVELGAGMFGAEYDQLDWQQAARSRQPASEWQHAPRWRDSGGDPHHRESAE